tara:strand:- start:44 stop:412 length:369 start_codon:yes stop_codon:yes gene_type:complete
MSEEEKEEPGFVIKDRRHSQNPEEDSEESSMPDDRGEPEPKDFAIDFSTFVLSLTSSAFYHLGDLADPESGEKKIDLPAVKQTIEILLLLKEKTAGNLNEEEEKLLEQLIYELQMKFVAVNK